MTDRTPTARGAFLAALATFALLALAPAAQASFGVTSGNFEAGTCNTASCTYASVRSNPGEAFTQAAGHPPYGITTFKLNAHAGLLGEEPEGALRRVRVDIPPGLAANPQALPQCTRAQFEGNSCAADTQVGRNELVAVLAGLDVPVTGQVYDLQQPPGMPLLFGIHVSVPPLVEEHIYLEGHVDWQGDYHEYFEINEISKEHPVLSSKLIFEGRSGEGDFLTLPSVCSATTVSHVEVESWEGQRSSTATETPVGVDGCGSVPFAPSVSTTAGTARADQPDGATVTVRVPQNRAAGATNTSDIRDVHVTLPEGLTLNPSAAGGQGTCTAAQFGAGSCPASSAIGSVAIETDLPPHSLTGAVYLASPSGATLGPPPWTLYLDAESPYGVSVRLQGQVAADPSTGRLTTTFLGNPQLPFSELALQLRGGPQAPLANPVACGRGQTVGDFSPWTGGADHLDTTPFATEPSGGGACAGAPPFGPTQATVPASHAAGASSGLTFTLTRPEGNQYLGSLSTTLPPGLVGLIPSVAQCPEPQARAGACPSTSQIGTASATAGSGPAPVGFSGPVYLTGPYGGSPFGLSIPIEAVAGPFDLGRTVTRARIDVDPVTARVIVTASPPSIVGGVPVRLRSLSVAVSRAGFLINPTDCSALATETVASSTLGAVSHLSTPFQVGACSSLPFTPSLSATTSSHASRAIGAPLTVTLSQPGHQAAIRLASVQLPLQLPSRLSTLQKACAAATYAASPPSCPEASKVGEASARTPVLPGTLRGPVYLVSHGGAAFPDLVVRLEGDGVHVVLVGNTAIHNGITTSTFQTLPDVPVSSFTVTLPTGPNSVLDAFGSLCAKPLMMPYVLIAHSGIERRGTLRIAVPDCPGARHRVRIVRRRLKGKTLLVTVATPEAGLVRASGRWLHSAARRMRRAGTTTLAMRLTPRGVGALRRGRLKLGVHVSFVPARRGASRSSATTTLIFTRRR